MNFLNSMVFSQLIVLFALIIIGFIARKFKVLPTESNKVLSRFVIKISMPAFILTAMQFEFSVEMLKNSSVVLVISAASYAFAILFSKLYTKIAGNSGDRANVLEYALVFTNTGFMGFPVVFELYGAEGVFYAAIFNLGFNLLAFTYGINLLSSKQTKTSWQSKLKMMIQPATIAIFIGYLTFLSGYTYSAATTKLLSTVGATATPLSMIFIGISLSEVNFRDIFRDKQIGIIIILRLMILPLISFFSLKLAGISGLALYIPVVMVAMPVAANSAIFAAEYDSDYNLASLLVFSSTLCSLISLPLLMAFIAP